MPEEFRIWKEKIDAIEAKKKQVPDHGHSKSHHHAAAAAAAASSTAAGVSADGSTTTANTEKSRKQRFII